MTAAVLVRKMWTTRRGVGLLIAAMMLATTVLLYMIALDIMQQARTVSYGSRIITPDQPAYCPGETMTFDVAVNVAADDLPVILHIVEAWWREADGITLQATARSYELPILRPVDVRATARRVVPDLPTGVYWLDHVSENGTIEAYMVGPIEIRPCQ